MQKDRRYKKNLSRNVKEFGNSIYFLLFAALVVISIIFFFKPSTTGQIILEKSYNYTDRINLSINDSREYVWKLENYGSLKSVKISGKAKQEGAVKVYLENENKTYLIFDSKKLEQKGLEDVTGFAIKEEQQNESQKEKDKDKEQNKTESVKEKKEKNKKPEWIGDDKFVINGTTMLNLSNYFIDEDNDTLTYSVSDFEGLEITISNEIAKINPTKEQDFNTTITFTAFDGIDNNSKTVKLIVLKKFISNITSPINETLNITPIINISINLQYNKNTSYDEDNDGTETLNGVIDFTVAGTSFNWNYSNSGLCTRWNIYSIENKESAAICYGNNNCCNFISLSPARESWNESLYLTYGQYGSTFNNLISAQVLYVNYNLSVENPFSEIYYSEWQNLTARFYKEFIEFEKICIETCALSNLNSTSYRLIFDIENSSISLDSISYEILSNETIVINETVNQTVNYTINHAPILANNFSNITIFSGESYIINLSRYFYDEDNDTLGYKYYANLGLDVNISNETSFIFPYSNFTGITYMYFTANDSQYIAVSNVFQVEVKESESKEKGKVIPKSGTLKSLRQIVGLS